jgi:hypothetical protein
MARLQNHTLCQVGQNKKLVRIDEDCINFLRPTQKAKLDTMRLLLPAFQISFQFAKNSTNPDFAQCEPILKSLIHELNELIERADSVTSETEVKVPFPSTIPVAHEFVLNVGLRTLPINRDLAAATRIMIGIASGRLRRLVIQVSQHWQGTEKHFLGVCETKLPENPDQILILSDATADRELLQKILVRPLVDITPQGHVAPHHRIVQIPIDVKRTTEDSSVVALLRDIMISNPTKSRIGVIMHSRHIGCLEELCEVFRERILMHTYFGKGNDRASNEWIENNLDLLIVLGTPRVAPHEIRSKMIQLGLDDGALASSEWNKRYWQGITESGNPVNVETKGYDDPNWQKAFEYLVHSALYQAIGRGRSALEEGMDTIVVTCEPLQVPIYEHTLPSMTDSCATAFNALISIGEIVDVDIRSIISEAADVDVRQSFKILKELVHLGILNKITRGSYDWCPQWRPIAKEVLAAP